MASKDSKPDAAPPVEAGKPDAIPSGKFIKVKANVKGNRTALWEVDRAHPNGEIFISGASDKPVEVARTSGVSKALADGRLVEV
ncbi:MAG: hypothetical protein L0229_22545 [Blastocatellia bacterium]|nr:hypothetical protein [Blastocatellia bacterium]